VNNSFCLIEEYEVKYQLTRLYQQLQQLTEHRVFKARRQQQGGPSAGSNDPENLHLHHYAPSPALTANTSMDIDSAENDSSRQSASFSAKDHTTKSGEPVPEEERRPIPAQNDLFTRSTLSLNTRRNRRLNYLLRYLAPPDSVDSQAGAIAAPSSKGRRSSGPNSQHQPHPVLATILSISGSMSNLSFSDSTYFSDAEMEARAPELYQQYIGRFMDNDNTDDESDEDEDEDEDGDVTGAEADDEREDGKRRASSKQQPEPFGKDVGLVDRILWNIDHPTKRQLKLQRQEEMDSQNRYQEGASGLDDEESPVETISPQQAKLEDEFEEEFDTESDGDDEAMDQDDRRGPLRTLQNDDDIVAMTSVTPPIPRDPTPGFLSSTMSSAAMTMEQPEARARFAEVENGNGLNSEDEEEDQETERRKEDQESLRRDFVLLMKQRFLDGLDINFDYSTVDFNESLDDLEQEDHDTEDRWFDADEEDEGDRGDEDVDLDEGILAENENGSRPKKSDSGRPSASSTRLAASSGLDYDERVRAWESSAQNGTGDYDY